MENLHNKIKKKLGESDELPFSVYTSTYEQKLLNVPIAKPLLITVISGDKKLGKTNDIHCAAGQFVFLSDSPAIDMRNIPKDAEYFALLIEFEYSDFSGMPIGHANQLDYFVGDMAPELENCLGQFVDCVSWATVDILNFRKREILNLLYSLGHKEVLSIMTGAKISHQLHDLFHDKSFQDITASFICDRLAMSESTLRRKLRAEGTSIQEIKDRARLGHALHLLQTTNDPIGIVSDKCGYHSQSRFTERFKGHFGLTPTELKKTKLTE